MNAAAAVIVPESPDEELIQNCENIGPAERKLRVRIGIFASASTVALGAVLAATHAWWPLRFLVAAPAMVAAMSFLQAWTHTCVAFVRANIKVMGDSRADRIKVTEEAERAAFQKKARRMYLQGAALTAVVVGLFLLLP